MVLCIFCVTNSYDKICKICELLAKSLALELEKPQTAQCPINWRASNSRAANSA